MTSYRIRDRTLGHIVTECDCNGGLRVLTGEYGGWDSPTAVFPSYLEARDAAEDLRGIIDHTFTVEVYRCGR